MKWFIALVFSLTSFNCFSQLLFGYLPGEPGTSSNLIYNPNSKLRVIIFPFQKTDFEIYVRNTKHRIAITDDNLRILYAQNKGRGHYEIITGAKVVYVHVYDAATGKNDTLDGSRGTKFTSILKYGNDEAEVKIKVTLLPPKTDTINKHFVRLLALDEDSNPPAFSMSLEKIPSPTSRTEPIWEPYWQDDNVLVNNDVYLKVKNYLLIHMRNYYSNINDVRIKRSDVLEIDMDFKRRLFIKSDDAIILLADFKRYLLKEKINYDIPDRLDNMINSLQFKMPRDKNGDPN